MSLVIAIKAELLFIVIDLLFSSAHLKFSIINMYNNSNALTLDNLR